MPSTRLYGPSGAPGAAGLVALNTQGAIAAVLPATQVVTSTTETVLLNPSLNSAIQALVLSIPTGGPLEKMPFDVLLSGTLNTGASSTVTIKLYNGTSTTVASDTLLGTTGAVSAFSGKAPFYVKATLIYDSVSGKLQGSVKALVNNNLVAEAAVSNVVTGLNNNNPAGIVTNFVASITFGTANAANSITVEDFCVSF